MMYVMKAATYYDTQPTGRQGVSRCARPPPLEILPARAEKTIDCIALRPVSPGMIAGDNDDIIFTIFVFIWHCSNR